MVYTKLFQRCKVQKEYLKIVVKMSAPKIMRTSRAKITVYPRKHNFGPTSHKFYKNVFAGILHIVTTLWNAVTSLGENNVI